MKYWTRSQSDLYVVLHVMALVMYHPCWSGYHGNIYLFFNTVLKLTGTQLHHLLPPALCPRVVMLPVCLYQCFHWPLFWSPHNNTHSHQHFDPALTACCLHLLKDLTCKKSLTTDFVEHILVRIGCSGGCSDAQLQNAQMLLSNMAFLPTSPFDPGWSPPRWENLEGKMWF